MNENAASSSVGTAPPLQVTRVTTAESPEPVFSTVRFQPGDGTNESIAKPEGGASSTVVVVAPSFSVGTASVNTCPALASTTGGLTCAWANAAPLAASAGSTASANTVMRLQVVIASLSFVGTVGSDARTRPVCVTQRAGEGGLVLRGGRRAPGHEEGSPRRGRVR